MMNNYKTCPLKKRPVFYDDEVSNNFILDNNEPQDLSVKRRKIEDECNSAALLTNNRNFPLNLSSNSFYDQMKQTTYNVWSSSPEHPSTRRSESPVSTYSDSSSTHRATSVSPPIVPTTPTNIHLRGLTTAQINETQSLYNSEEFNAYLPQYVSDRCYYSSTVFPCSLTPPASPKEDSEPEDLSMKNFIPLPALYHNSTVVEKEKIDPRSRFRCENCGKSYSTLTGLSKHKQFHCPAAECNQIKKTFSCKSCDKVYTSLGALKMHIRTHTLPCRCTICGKCFSRPWLLQGHIRTHTGEKPFKCDHCHRAFADRSNLRAHQQTHVEVKKYICDCCNKSFSRMSLLNKHIQGGCSGQGY